MAHSLSAQKRVRQAAKRRRQNKHYKTVVKTTLKNATTPKDGKLDPEALRAACRVVDKAAAKGLLHPNTAARRKSRLMRMAAPAKPAAK